MIRFAARVLVHSEQEKQHEHKAQERRRVIQEATTHERRGSLSEQVSDKMLCEMIRGGEDGGKLQGIGKV